MCFMLPNQDKVGTQMLSFKIFENFLRVQGQKSLLSNISKNKPFRVSVAL